MSRATTIEESGSETQRMLPERRGERCVPLDDGEWVRVGAMEVRLSPAR